MSAKGGSDPCSGSRARSATTAELSGGATGASKGQDRLLDLAAAIELSLASPRLADAGRALFAALGRLPQGLAEALFGEEASEAARGLLAAGLAPADAGWLPELDRHLAAARAKAGRGGGRD